MKTSALDDFHASILHPHTVQTGHLVQAVIECDARYKICSKRKRMSRYYRPPRYINVSSCSSQSILAVVVVVVVNIYKTIRDVRTNIYSYPPSVCRITLFPFTWTLSYLYIKTRRWRWIGQTDGNNSTTTARNRAPEGQRKGGRPTFNKI